MRGHVDLEQQGCASCGVLLAGGNPCTPRKLWKSFCFPHSSCRGEETLSPGADEDLYSRVQPCRRGEEGQQLDSQYVTWPTKCPSGKQYIAVGGDGAVWAGVPLFQPEAGVVPP